MVEKLSGTVWTNQLGSKATFTFGANDHLEGTYETSVGAATKAEELRGYWRYTTDGALVGWTVLFKDTKDSVPSIATWCGIIDIKNSKLSAQWFLTKESDQVWENTLVGKDTFEIRTN